MQPFVLTINYRPHRVDLAALSRSARRNIAQGILLRKGGPESEQALVQGQRHASRTSKACRPVMLTPVCRLLPSHCSGQLAEVLNLVPWGGVSLQFRHLRLFGMQGINGVGAWDWDNRLLCK